MPGLFSEATPSDYKQQEQNVVSEVVRRAQEQISGVNTQSDVHVRDILPSEDLGSGADNGWGGDTRVWLQGGLSVDTLNETYTIESDGDMEGKVLAIYAIEAQQPDPATTEITFEDGTGSRFERLAFQESHATGNAQYVSALLRNPIIFNEGKDGKIAQWADADVVDDELILHGVVAEKAGTTLGTRSQSESSAAGVARQPSQ